MSKEDLLQDINLIFRSVFDKEDLQINSEMIMSDIEDWDSLAHIRLIVAISEKYGIEFSMDEMLQIVDVKTLLASIANKLK